MRHASFLLLTLAIAGVMSSSALAPDHRRPMLAMAGRPDKLDLKPPSFLQGAYTAAGVATTATWANIVRTTIRSNQPVGAMMPSVQHQIFGRTSVLSAVPLIVAAYGILGSAAKDSWDKLSSDTCRRLNLALATATAGGALWVNFAPIITAIPGSTPPACHQAYSGLPKAAMIASYAGAAALSAGVWARSLPEDVRSNPLSWPGRVADGVCKSLCSLGPAKSDNPVNVKYSILTGSFLVLTALQLGTIPTAVVPSWTGRRLSRHFPAWTLLAAASAFSLKEATESGKLHADQTFRKLSNGLAGMGAVYLTAKFGSVFLDPSWPTHYALVTKAPAWQLAASMMFAMTLRPDGPAKASASKPAAKAKAASPKRAAASKKSVMDTSAGAAAASLMAGVALGVLCDKKE